MISPQIQAEREKLEKQIAEIKKLREKRELEKV